MKIKVSEIKPNPYRKMDKYPINRDKVESLKESIKNTEFWDNILAREVNGTIQIAYGHHRLTALKELEIEYIDIPVKNIDDATMIKIMANENMDDWKMTTSVIIETVQTAKEFLESELAKYDKFDDIPLGIYIHRFFDKFNFDQQKQNGVGYSIINKFLGSNWKEHDIKQALTAIKGYQDQPIDKEAVMSFNEQRHAKVFMEQTRLHAIPIEKQKEIAEKVIERIIETKKPVIKNNEVESIEQVDFSGHDIREAFYEVQLEENKKDHPERFEKSNIQKAIDFSELNHLISSLNSDIEKIGDLIMGLPFEYRERYYMGLTNTVRIIQRQKDKSIREVK